MHLQCVYVVWGLKPGAALVVVCLAIVTLPPISTEPAMAGCSLVEALEKVVYLGTSACGV